MRLAVTGATGFVGSRLIALAAEAGHECRALTRRPQPSLPRVEWIDGALDWPDSLDRLVANADAVIHVAGVVNAPDRAGFEAGNVAGTAAMLGAARRGGVGRFVHVSSLAAREPDLSLYGASKAAGERLVEAGSREQGPADWAIVRPPAIYGPGDRELLELFGAAQLGIVPLPPPGRLSIVHVDDLARLLLALAAPEAPSAILWEADDGRPGGYTHREFALAIGSAVNRRPLTVSVPKPLLKMAAKLDRLIRRDRARLTPDRAAYFCHPDWVVDPARVPPRDFWRAQIAIDDGLDETASWYRARGWL